MNCPKHNETSTLWIICNRCGPTHANTRHNLQKESTRRTMKVCCQCEQAYLMPKTWTIIEKAPTGILSKTPYQQDDITPILGCETRTSWKYWYWWEAKNRTIL